MLLLCSLFQDEKGERGGHVEEAREGRAALDRGRGGPHKGTRTREVYRLCLLPYALTPVDFIYFSEDTSQSLVNSLAQQTVPPIVHWLRSCTFICCAQSARSFDLLRGQD